MKRHERDSDPKSYAREQAEPWPAERIKAESFGSIELYDKAVLRYFSLKQRILNLDLNLSNEEMIEYGLLREKFKNGYHAPKKSFT